MTPPSPPDSSLPRRSFMARLGAAVAAFGGASGLAAQPAEAAATPAPWAPTRHAQDDWLDALPGQHRFFFDTTSVNGAGEGITFASNFLAASKSGYNLDESQNAVIIGLRHFSTPFAFTDAIWAKYGAVFADRLKWMDPKTNAAPVINVYLTTGYGMTLPNRETTLTMMAQRGVHYAVCDMATKAFAGLIATRVQRKSAEVYDELRAAAIANTHFVSAGIVAVNRAQERGYSISHIG
jgi:intracellular sulfur oxidation DsrE/DsrF family protein